MTATIDSSSNKAATAGGCPFHGGYSQRKTDSPVPKPRPMVEQDAAGVWHIRGFDEARAVLRADETKQAGFRAENIAQLPSIIEAPILYMEGKPHHTQRAQTARFFTPKFTNENHRAPMERLADTIIAELRRKKQADLSVLTMRLAASVAAWIVGLTNSLLPGMEARIEAFFVQDEMKRDWSPRAVWDALNAQRRLLSFYLLDVLPAIRARRKQPREDVISHLIARGANSASIMTECVTYGAAGMVTTREFISVATWHMLEHPELRQRFLQAPEEERRAILHEILRLEPVVGHIQRTTTDAVTFESEGRQITIPAGQRINIHVYGANADERAVGSEPTTVCPARELRDERVALPIMSFGDGHHRCPGAYVAIQESDIFLSRLLAIPTLRMVRKPRVGYDATVSGYELRDFIVAV